VILGRVLAEARDRAGLKQSEVAARLEVPASYLSKIESGTRRLDVVELIRIAQAMEIDPATVIDEIAARIGGVRED
jgi:transcriptional regulator with XRE-family HTH domain